MAIIPFYLLVLYWHPVGTHGLDWISNWNGRFDEHSWWYQQKEWYFTTMGRYTSTALLSTTAKWYSTWSARGVILLLLIALPVTLYFVFRSIFQGTRRITGICWALLITALWFGQLANPYDTLYRWSGLFTYHTGLLATLLLTGLLLRGWYYWALLVVLFAVGTNEISLVQCGVLLGGYFIWQPEKKMKLPAAILLVGAAAGAVFSLAAPGNWVRAEEYMGGHSWLSSVFLTVASGGFSWLQWLGGSAFLLFLILVNAAPELKLALSNRQRLLLVFSALVWPLISFAPVILATKGASLPEGITDWQIIPVLLIGTCLAASLPKVHPPVWLTRVLLLAVFLPLLFGGLAIDRTLSSAPRAVWERIVVNSTAGRAWQQLLSGQASIYSTSVERQYKTIKRCNSSPCILPPLIATQNNYLYDPSYDRRLTGTECCLGAVVNRPSLEAKYSD